VLWPGESPIGRRIAMPEHPTPSDWLTIVGVVDDVRQRGLATGVDPAIYQPYPQVKSAFFLSHMTFALRTTSDPLRLAPAIRATLKNLDADLPAQSIASMPDLIAETTAEPRFQARLLAIFAAMAFALAFVGIYGVLTYSVALRRREFGIRMALGARSADMLGLVLRRTVTLAALGIVIGWAGALALTRVLATSKFLFDVKPHDPAVFGAVAVTILAAALLAGFIPGLRARRVDPIVALRAE